MCVPAGGTDITLHGNLIRGRNTIFPLYQVTGIGSKRGQRAFCMAERADPIRMGQAACFFLQPLSVCERYLIQLAKNSKWTYHRYVSLS